LAKIELHERFFGSGLVGQIDFAPNELAYQPASVLVPGLPTPSSSRVIDALDRLGWDIRWVAESIRSLEDELASRLSEQTAYMERQLDALESIDRSLLDSLKVRAAQRMDDAAGLLQRGKYPAALHYACEAIDCDPNNPYGYVAAGFAYIGLGEPGRASESFVEARDAATDEQWFVFGRLGAHSSIVAGELHQARAILDNALARLNAETSRRGAIHYDLALVAILASESSTAVAEIEKAVRTDVRYAAEALCEPLFDDTPEVRAHATYVAEEVGLAARAERITARLDTLFEGRSVPTELLPLQGRAAGLLTDAGGVLQKSPADLQRVEELLADAEIACSEMQAWLDDERARIEREAEERRRKERQLAEENKRRQQRLAEQERVERQRRARWALEETVSQIKKEHWGTSSRKVVPR
jgi:Flp pilus assembly protein TadD